MERSEELFKKACEMMPGGVSSPVRAYRSVGMTPRFIEKAKGSHVYDVDGRTKAELIREVEKESSKGGSTSGSGSSGHSSGKLPQTGQLWWPVPMLIFAGLLCIVVGLIRRRGTNHGK